ncbi:MAG TPA: ABATE domain-containing protein [Granulicella sp.]|jgi:predicted RNA-binding Zn ribbon-like protein
MAIEQPTADDLYSFRFRGGCPSLNLVATVGWRSAAKPVERFRSAGDLADWLLAEQLVAVRPKVMPDELTSARRLREVIYRLVMATMKHQLPNPNDIALINRWSHIPEPVLTLKLEDGLLHLQEETLQPTKAALSVIARDAICLLGSKSILRVKECARPDCTLLFVDASRSGRRRWCSMDACGNRSKTVQYRRRLKGRESPTKTSA